MITWNFVGYMRFFIHGAKARLPVICMTMKSRLQEKY